MRCRYESSVGAYVLGTLDPAERAEVAEHMQTCERCRSVRTQFAGLPGLLSRLSLDEVSSGPPRPDESAYERLTEAVAEERGTARRRRLVLAVAAAVVLILALGAGAVAVRLFGGDEAITRTAAAGSIQARATVSGTESGSRLNLELAGVRPGQRCRLVAVDAGGHRDVAGSWVANYAGWAEITGWTSVAPDHLDQLLIETFRGDQLVAIPMDEASGSDAPAPAEPTFPYRR